MFYGMPYMGSKNLIAKEIIETLPEAECFVDLFGGGGALSHCAYCSKKYKKIIYNEIDTNICNIFKNACLGKYKTFKWLSKEEYDRKLDVNDIDMEILIFSFGYNIQKGYFAQKKKEMLWKACYEYIYNNELDGLKNNELIRKYNYKINIEDFLKLNSYNEKLKKLKYFFVNEFKNNKQYIINENDFNILSNLYLECFNRFERIKALSEIKNIQFYNKSYEEIEIPENSVVICDIPYRGRAEYSVNKFDYEKFYNWCLNNKNMIFINEYSMPDDFYLVKSFKKTQILSATSNSKYTYKEKLYCNRKYEPFGINDLF